MRPGVDVDTRAAVVWEIVGFFFIVGAGTLLHFAFHWANEFPLVAPFAAVNESAWEHLKLAFWPTVAWTLLEHPPLRTRVNNFRLARTLGTLLMPAIILGLHYFYVFLLGVHVLYLDIAIFIIAVLAGQLVSCRLMTGDERSPAANVFSPILLVALAMLFIVFTFAPPHVGLFRDGLTGAFGILN